MFENTLNSVELGVYNALGRNQKHKYCSLVLKTSYKSYCHYALYCADHDFFLQWVSEDDFDDYEKLGIHRVTYPDDELFSRARSATFLTSYDNQAYKELFVDYNVLKIIKVINYKTGKKTDIWIAFKDNPHRDPSLSSYWEFVEKFKS